MQRWYEQPKKPPTVVEVLESPQRELDAALSENIALRDRVEQLDVRVGALVEREGDLVELVRMLHADKLSALELLRRAQLRVEELAAENEALIEACRG